MTSPPHIPPEFALANYVYELPPERIAIHPSPDREKSRLLVLEKNSATAPDLSRCFSDLPEILAAKCPEGALLIVNNSRVFPARLFGRRATGGQVELLLLTPLPLLKIHAQGGVFCAEAEALVRTAKRMKEGETADFGVASDGQNADLAVTLLSRGDYGRCLVRLCWRGDLMNTVSAIGHVPLPPYLERPDEKQDRERYQTVYADDHKAGSVAAPTAGLHFTEGLRTRLKERGFDWAEVTLYVGYGTFSPVRAVDIREHKMHAEHVEVSAETASAIRRAKRERKKIIAVGTTSARSLEGMYHAASGVSAFRGNTEIFITPGHKFRVVDGLITNFHLPESSLLIMVSALAGHAQIMGAYAAALAANFRFYSYGDAMLIV